MSITAIVKIKLARRHPMGKMSHGSHSITPEVQTLNFTADELQDLKGAGPKHWFQFSVIKEISPSDQKEIDAMKAKKKQEEADRLAAEEKAKEEADLAELERLDQLEKEALMNQQNEQDNNEGDSNPNVNEGSEEN